MGQAASKLVMSLAVVALVVGCGGDDDSTSESAPTAETTAAGETDAPDSDTFTSEPAPADTSPPDPAPTEPAPTEPPATEPPATEPPVTEPPATEPAATEPAATEPPTTEGPSGDGSCLVGEWVVTEEQMNAFYAGLITTVDAPLEISVVGSAPLTLVADRTYQWEPDFTLSVSVAGQAGTGLTGGTISGSWSADDGVVTTASDVNALTIEVTVAGATFSGDDFANGLLNASPINGVTYSCSGGTPVLDFKTADPEITVPITLAPA